MLLGGTGGFTYTPARHWSGDDLFTYKASDGQLYSNVATVTIHVTLSEDVAITSFTTDGTLLYVSYTVTGGNSAAFLVGLNALPTGTGIVQTLQAVTASGSPGAHTVPVSPFFHDPTGDYDLAAMVDCDDEINESNEANNTLTFAGGTFVSYDPVLHGNVLQVHGTNNADDLSISADDADCTLLCTIRPCLRPVPSGEGPALLRCHGRSGRWDKPRHREPTRSRHLGL